ncbi:regulator of chromosome condensation 1/beta-lactamase-inhibitor protein II [Dactylonectria estremocensis]|uniref:Regulator of chromosome condensation 1/beta-lactamase-inhibitor protein II n=1 Tax=Dactylonectria estremocensis TaxID=1079267 RepID=A0A9P9IQJ2_9HYPO|nr:regulator of chromosome condensation 1/beta-lactamase-inhibitor protein II [Dactylonectria estremocensis]
MQSRSQGSQRPNKRARISIDAVRNEAPTTRLNVFVFGSGESAELGLGPGVFNRKSPLCAKSPRLNHILAAEESGIVQLAVGGMHCAALTGNGKVLTWGVNDSMALGRDTTWVEPDDDEEGMPDLNPLESTPMAVENLQGIGDIVQVAAADNSTFVLTAAGQVYGWGTFNGDDGPFGFLKEAMQLHDKPSHKEKFSLKPAHIPGLSGIKELAAGGNHILALTHSGNVYSWGAGHHAELGRRVISRRPFEALNPRLVALPQNHITSVYAGHHHSFAIDVAGRVFSWGLNNFGQTGHSSDRDNFHIATPTIVESLQGVQILHMSAGFHHSVACTQDGGVFTWGRCDDAQIGVALNTIHPGNLRFDARNQPRIVTKPTLVKGIDAVFVAAGIDNTIAVTRDGKTLSWGFSANYRTGLRTEDSVQIPTLLKGTELDTSHISFAACGGQFSVVAGPAAEKKDEVMEG